ncbi:hypothetical protein P5673_003564 [Acropora cervicornis]|uniref:Uncharacterized protein n=1 Tax=Acropora cervicornis TaxID=6130 RepID=A0AAD9VEL0_ACRCE|nr:hypothetical protein P5673_003564 [Acropora cervicornis]
MASVVGKNFQPLLSECKSAANLNESVEDMDSVTDNASVENTLAQGQSVAVVDSWRSTCFHPKLKMHSSCHALDSLRALACVPLVERGRWILKEFSLHCRLFYSTDGVIKNVIVLLSFHQKHQTALLVKSYQVATEEK